MCERAHIDKEFVDDEESYTIKRVMRKDLKPHLKDECRRQPYQCEHCGKRGIHL